MKTVDVNQVLSAQQERERINSLGLYDATFVYDGKPVTIPHELLDDFMLLGLSNIDLITSDFLPDEVAIWRAAPQNNKNDEFSVIPKEGEFRSASEEGSMTTPAPQPEAQELVKLIERQEGRIFGLKVARGFLTSHRAEAMSLLEDELAEAERDVANLEAQLQSPAQPEPLAQDGAQVEELDILDVMNEVGSLFESGRVNDARRLVIKYCDQEVATATQAAAERARVQEREKVLRYARKVVDALEGQSTPYIQRQLEPDKYIRTKMTRVEPRAEPTAPEDTTDV